MTDPCDLSAREARRLIGQRRLSPVELLESCLARIAAVDPAVNAFVELDAERAMHVARAAEAAVARGASLGRLHGLPVGIKNLQDTAGLRTTYGSPIFRDHVPATDWALVARLRDAGAIVLGKTNTPEFGAGANTVNPVHGATGNPFDPRFSCAGSSGGSAVALATGMVPLATGDDVGGSLRNPAAWCGVIGYRTSPGTVPVPGRTLAWQPLSVAGPMAREVSDVAMMLAVIAGDDSGDPLAATALGRHLRDPSEFDPVPTVDLAALAVAFTADFGFAPVSSAVRELFAARTALLAPLFSTSDEATPDCGDASNTFAVLRGLAFLAGQAENVRTRPELVGPLIRANVEEALRFSALDVARAMTAQSTMYRNWQVFFAEWDVLIAPALPVPPFPWSEPYVAEIDGVAMPTYYHWLGLPVAATLAGHPALCLPLGTDRVGLPFGVQIIGPRGGDAFVLGVAAALERALAGDARTARPVPDLAALKAAPPIRSRPGFPGSA